MPTRADLERRANLRLHREGSLEQKLRALPYPARFRFRGEDVDVRPYQLRCLQAGDEALIAGWRRMLFEKATGTGKTLTIAMLMKRWFQAAVISRALFLADRIELAQKLDSPEFWFTEATLRKAFDQPSGSMSDFIRATLGLHQLPTRQQRVERAFNVWVAEHSSSINPAKLVCCGFCETSSVLPSVRPSTSRSIPASSLARRSRSRADAPAPKPCLAVTGSPPSCRN